MWTVVLLAALKTAPLRRTTSNAPQRRTTSNAPLRSVFVQHATNMPPAQPPATFRAWPALNDEATRMAVNAGRRFRLHLANETRDDPTYALFEGDALMNRFALALARRRSIDRKEYFESCEFFARARRKLRADGGGAGATTLVDVAGGHGLVGVLAAIFMARHFERVIVRDIRRPAAFDDVLAAAVEVAPWVEGRVVYEEEAVGPHAPLPTGCAVACVHGCKGLTDEIIAAAAAADARSIACMPCCYRSTAASAPEALRLSLGVPLAADVMRTLELERLGYTVQWKEIPATISPMNRLILAHRAPRVDD